MPRTKSERVAAEAVGNLQDGNVREAILGLIDYADRSVRNRTTERAFKRAIDEELAKAGIGQVNAPDDDAPRCVHCRSTSTYFRVSDGDVACNNCPGIMPHDEVAR